jgi:UPF0042 nucleotide-binding protein
VTGKAKDKTTTRKEAPSDRLVLVTGLSGAGRSSALKILEDMGYEVVDNLPIGLITKLIRTEDDNPEHVGGRPLAIGVDTRTRAFLDKHVVRQIEYLRERAGLDVYVLFLDCNDDVLARRFSETRRRHPLATDRPISDGIARERELLLAVRHLVDMIVDTSNLTVQDLRLQLSASLAPERPMGLTLTIMSFGFARGLPRDADLVLDVRFLRNPHYVEALRPLTGKDEAVAAYVAADPDFATVFERMRALVEILLPRYREEGKAYLTIAIGCTGGRHRSVFVAGLLAEALANAGYQVNMRHRDLEAPAAGG